MVQPGHMTVFVSGIVLQIVVPVVGVVSMGAVMGFLVGQSDCDHGLGESQCCLFVQ